MHTERPGAAYKGFAILPANTIMEPAIKVDHLLWNEVLLLCDVGGFGDEGIHRHRADLCRQGVKSQIVTLQVKASSLPGLPGRRLVGLAGRFISCWES
jgi:hypothetical protein